MSTLASKTAGGATWMVLFRILERSIGVVSTLILARLLVPDDFGLVALATAFIALADLCGDFNFDVPLIQRRRPSRADYDTAWTFNLIVGGVQALLVVGTAAPVARFYDDPRIEPILYWLAAGFLLTGLRNVGVVDFRRNLEFHREFVLLTVRKLAGFAVAIPLAFALRSYWALVWGMLAGKIADLVLTYAMHAYRPRFSMASWVEMYRFTRWLQLNSVLYFFEQRSADIVLGKTVGTGGLGVFAIANEIANLPTTDLAAPINRVAFPAYSTIQSDPAAMRWGYLRVISVVALLVVPAGLGIAAVAEPLVLVALGEKWRAAIPLIEVLAVAGTVVALHTNAGAAYLALGRPQLITLISAIRLAVLVPALVILTSTGGVTGAVTAIAATSAVMFAVNTGFLSRVLGIGPGTFLGAIHRPLIAGVAMYGAVHWSLGFLGTAAPGWRLAAGVGTGVVAYAALVLAMWAARRFPEGAERWILVRAGAWLRRGRAPR